MSQRTHEFLLHCRMKWKYCLSFLKKDWQFHDYPISIEKRATPPPQDGRPSHVDPYLVRIEGWPLMTRTGQTRAEALGTLKDDFERQKAWHAERGEPLPRPGIAVPIQFASGDQVDAHSALLQDFIQRVLHLEWAFVTDESRLWDFPDSRDVYLARIRQIYGVDCSELASAPVADILDHIAAWQELLS